MVDYYDKLLVAIPAAIAAGALVGVSQFAAVHQGLAAGSLLATVLLFDALFRNPPAEPTASNMGALVGVSLGWLLTAWLFL